MKTLRHHISYNKPEITIPINYSEHYKTHHNGDKATFYIIANKLIGEWKRLSNFLASTRPLWINKESRERAFRRIEQIKGELLVILPIGCYIDLRLILHADLYYNVWLAWIKTLEGDKK